MVYSPGMGRKQTSAAKPAAKADKQDTGLINIGVPKDVHTEISQFADAKGLKLRALMPKLWEVFKTLPDDRQRDVLFGHAADLHQPSAA